eukprot:GHRR01025555.1.p1 GENE.GHRR01025555.1~~GHRR01025555.1.p1  ORF type:complete len:603 (+),score=233.97 GHRR01025555.1:438-2246(+)
MWYRFKGKHKRERAVLAGCSLGSDAPAIAIPLIEALAGPVGVVAACAATITNTFAVYGGSYLLFGSAGPAFPKSYKHDDGGTYRGEWRGMSKEGLGVYRYASGARYEGEWRNNVKDGRGVYYFPKGGTYEGEWSNGVMTGTGLRTYSNGKVSAGRWEDNKLLTPLELWQCATAAEGAAEAAMAAGRVHVGGGKPFDALQLLVVQPVQWAAILGLALNLLNIPLPGSFAAVAGALAPANKPLMLLSAGMLLQPQLPQIRQVADVTVIMAARVAAALFWTANALMLLPGASEPTGVISILSAAIILLSPVPCAAIEFTRNFRLNEVLAQGCRDASLLVAAPLLVLLVLAAGGLQLLPAQQLVTTDITGATTMLAAVMLVLAAAVAVAAGVVQDRLAPEKGIIMRYAARAAPAAATAPESGSSGGGDTGAEAAGGTTAAALGAATRRISRHSSSCTPQDIHCPMVRPAGVAPNGWRWRLGPHSHSRTHPTVACNCLPAAVSASTANSGIHKQHMSLGLQGGLWCVQQYSKQQSQPCEGVRQAETLIRRRQQRCCHLCDGSSIAAHRWRQQFSRHSKHPVQLQQAAHDISQRLHHLAPAALACALS